MNQLSGNTGSRLLAGAFLEEYYLQARSGSRNYVSRAVRNAVDALIHLEDKIRSTGAALGRLEAELPHHSESRSLMSNILSLRKLHKNLRDEFDEVANELGFDILHYERAIPQSGNRD